MSTSADELLVRAAIVDELSAPLRVIDAEVDKVTASLERLKVAGGAAGAGGSITRLGAVTGELTKLAKGAHGTLLDVSDALGSKLTSAAKGAVEGVVGIGAALTVMGVKATETIESARLGIETFTGSVVKGDSLFGQLRGLTGPFNLTQVSDAAQSLLVASDGAATLIPRMKALADIAATQADPAGALNTLADSLNRIQESGTVDARTIRPLLSAGVPVYELLAGEMGISPDQVKKTLSTGAPLDLPMRFLADIDTEAGPLAKFQGALDKQRSTLRGQFEGINLSARGALGDVFSPLGDSLKTVTPLIRSGLVDLIRGVGPDLVTFLTAIASVAAGLLPIVRPIVASVLGALGQVLLALVPALNQLAPHVPELAQAFADLIVAFIPAIPPLTTLTIALLPVLVIGIRDVTNVVTTLIRWLTPLVDWISRTVDHSQALRDVLGAVLTGLLAYKAVSEIVGIIQGVSTAITGLATALGILKTAEEGAAAAGGIGAAAGGAAAGGSAAAGGGGLIGGLGGLAGTEGAGAAAALGGTVGVGLGFAALAVALDQWSKKHPAEAKQFADINAARDDAARRSAADWMKTGAAPVAYQPNGVTYVASAADNTGTTGARDTTPLTPQEQAELDPRYGSLVVNGPLVAVAQANAHPDDVAAAVGTAIDDRFRQGRQR